MIQQNLRDQNIQEDGKIYDYVRELRNAWEERLTLMLETMTTKIDKVEGQIGQAKAGSQFKEIQTQLNDEIQRCVGECENQLLQLRTMIDSKLDKDDLDEIVEGYRSVQINDQFQEFQDQVAAIRGQFTETTNKVNRECEYASVNAEPGHQDDGESK